MAQGLKYKNTDKRVILLGSFCYFGDVYSTEANILCITSYQ